MREPYHKQFKLLDPEVNHPHADPERVPPLFLFIYAGFVPLGTLVAWAIVFRPGVHKAHVTILGFFVSVICTIFVTDVLKNAVGEPRPDLLARCKPRPGTPDNVFVSVEICTETRHHLLHDGWRSFPSGHSSFSFSGLGYLAFFLASQLHVFNSRPDLIRVLLVFVPFTGAALIALSRYEDYRHDVWDVSGGSLLGLLVAFFAWRRYYPPLRSTSCDTPYPVHGSEHDTWSKKRLDDEARIGDAREFDVGGEDDEAAPLNAVSRS